MTFSDPLAASTASRIGQSFTGISHAALRGPNYRPIEGPGSGQSVVLGMDVGGHGEWSCGMSQPLRDHGCGYSPQVHQRATGVPGVVETDPPEGRPPWLPCGIHLRTTRAIYIWPSSLTTRCSLPQSRTGRSVRRPGCQSLPCLWVLSERRADTMASSSGRVRLPRSVFGGTSTIPAPVTSTLALWIVSVWSSRAISDEHLATAKPRRAGMLSSADDQSRPRGRWLLFQPYRCAFPSWSGWDAPPWPPHSESGCLGVPRHRAHHLTRSASGSQTGG
jgi:hypothetical protein